MIAEFIKKNTTTCVCVRRSLFFWLGRVIFILRAFTFHFYVFSFILLQILSLSLCEMNHKYWSKSCEDKRPSMSSTTLGMCHNIFMIVSMFATTTEGPICRTIRFLTVTYCSKLAAAAPSLQVSLIVAGSPRHTKYPFFHSCQSTPSRYRNHPTTF